LPYCRRCGTKLEENARFCYKCGTPAGNFISAPAAPVRSLRHDPLFWIVTSVIVIVLVAVVVSVVVFAPIYEVTFNKTNQDSSSGVNTLNLNFQSDNAQVNIITQNVTDKNILINVSAEGSRSIFGSENSIQVTFTNESSNGVLTVNSKVIQTGLMTNAHVVCDIYVNPLLKLNLNVTSTTGEVSLTANAPATVQSLNLEATTGTVQANLERNVTVSGDISLKAQIGAVYYRMNKAKVQGNCTINLQSATGSVDMEITEEKTLQGNLQVNAATTTGAIDVGLQIDGDVGAKIVSQTGQFGSIHVDKENFSGNQSPIQSNNFPAQSNIQINNSVSSFGDININASYVSSVTPSGRN